MDQNAESVVINVESFCVSVSFLIYKVCQVKFKQIEWKCEEDLGDFNNVSLKSIFLKLKYVC